MRENKSRAQRVRSRREDLRQLLYVSFRNRRRRSNTFWHCNAGFEFAEKLCQGLKIDSNRVLCHCRFITHWVVLNLRTLLQCKEILKAATRDRLQLMCLHSLHLLFLEGFDMVFSSFLTKPKNKAYWRNGSIQSGQVTITKTEPESTDNADPKMRSTIRILLCDSGAGKRVACKFSDGLSGRCLAL